MSRLIRTVPALACILVSQTVASQTFTTEFDGTENPLSESGVWSHTGLDWTKVQKANGIAFGTQTGNGGYDDSYALSFWLRSQSGGIGQSPPEQLDRQGAARTKWRFCCGGWTTIPHG